MLKDSFNNILLDNNVLFGNSNFSFNISLSTPEQILDKSNDGVCNSFKQNDSHIEKSKIISKKSLMK